MDGGGGVQVCKNHPPAIEQKQEGFLCMISALKAKFNCFIPALKPIFPPVGLNLDTFPGEVDPSECYLGKSYFKFVPDE